MSEEEKIIDEGRENDEMTKFSYGIYQQIQKFQEEHPKTNAMVLMTDGAGGADFMIGEPSKLAKDFLEVADRNDGFLEVLKKILKALKDA